MSYEEFTKKRTGPEVWLFVGAVLIAIAVVGSALITVRANNNTNAQIESAAKIGVEQRQLIIDRQAIILARIDSLRTTIRLAIEDGR